MKKLLLGIMCAVSIGIAHAESLQEIERREIANSISSSSRNQLFTSTDNFNYNQWKNMSSNDGSFGQTNSIYRLLKSDYGLNENVQCTKYVAHTYSDEEYRNIGAKNRNSYANTMVGHAKKQELGIDDERTIWMTDSVMTLNRDLAFVLKVVADQNEKNPAHSEQEYVEQREVILRFIGKSCDTPFKDALNRYLNDFGKEVTIAYQTKMDLVKREDLIKQQQIDEQNKQDKAYKQKLYEEQVKRNQQTTCRSSKGYSLYESASSILGAKNSIRYAKEELARDDEVSKIGGVQNMTLRYRASKTIVDSTERMKTQFSKYKSLGGTAPSANAVTVLKNPCI